MRRPIVLIGLFLLASGCAKVGTTSAPADPKPSSGGGGDTRPTLTRQSSSLDVVKDYLSGSAFTDVQIDSREEKETTLNKQPAVALHLHWRSKDDTEARNELFILQGQRVKEQTPYDPAKSFEDNIAATIRNLEMP